MSRVWRRDVVAAVGLSLILLGSANQLAIAVGWIALGNEPGEGPGRLETAGVAVGWIAMFIVAVFYAVAPLRSEQQRRLKAEPLLALAGAAFMLALFYSFDPYYLPDLQRYAENDYVHPAWVYGVVGGAVIAGAWAALTPVGLRLTALVLFLCFGTMIFIPGGH